jgi:hypothetical protein
LGIPEIFRILKDVEWSRLQISNLDLNYDNEVDYEL